MSVPLESIRFASEREFAKNYFTHSDWDYQPRRFPLHYRWGLTYYTPDFYDCRRLVFIEVIGNPGVLLERRDKYLLFRNTYPQLNYEIYAPNGQRAEDPIGNLTVFAWKRAMGIPHNLKCLSTLRAFSPFGQFNNQ